MNYQHVYHSGNFADVFKHVLLIALIESLNRKESPYCYIDTHAGEGYYDLTSQAAIKTGEFRQGIAKIIQTEDKPAIIQTYLTGIKALNQALEAKEPFQFYPGSPWIAQYFSRTKDKIIACELHSQAHRTLKKNFAQHKRIAIHHLDGFQALKAFVPPIERRGLILIDPPFEKPDEFTQLNKAARTALSRWATGILAIWYPLKDEHAVQYFYRNLKQNIDQPNLVIELRVLPTMTNTFYGCGLIIFNPPWQLDLTINSFLPWLKNALSINKQGTFRIFSLK